MNTTAAALADQPYEIITDFVHVTKDTTRVTNRGEPLHEILWQGNQWTVTEYGIEARNGTYAIAADRLSETCPHQGHELPFWPLHMAEKTWVDIHDFCTAFLAALACYPEFAKFNGMQIRESIRRAIIEAST